MRSFSYESKENKTAFYIQSGLISILGIDAEAARNEEERVMLHDANQWLNNKSYDEQPHPKTGATALHVAAAKGYINVMK